MIAWDRKRSVELEDVFIQYHDVFTIQGMQEKGDRPQELLGL